VDGFTPDFFIYLGAVAFIDEGIEKHFWLSLTIST
jgi:hypothetical protein